MLAGYDPAFLNLLLQILSVLVLFIALSQVHKDPSGKHCRLVSVAVLLQLVSIIAFMSPSMSQLLNMGVGSSLSIQMYLHHLAGLLVIIFAIYIKLAVYGRIRSIVNPFKLMKITLALWILVFIGGLGLYMSIREGISLF